ncbi:hypothetical protein EYC98_17190 [Halieaceae bacterium IMCC14734]|uniref:Cohesin domain-containing protein n=1 Tax=Candidatus Litorirhabdus singularis TaxID=2518993 RepID=A0ABT3TJV4_9GAMM|nr:cohesin domain-containing protein [Candidatus Litorirhabdus singularis]MCX2982600.1 hypothetical protein [Candidatus Litorirhabdus singularis]
MLCGILMLLCPPLVWAESLALSSNLTGAPGGAVTSSLTITDVNGLIIESMDIRVSYDPSAVDFIAARNGAGLQGGPYSPTSPVINDTGGLVIISNISLIVGVTPTEGAVLLELDFLIRDDAATGTTVQEVVEVLINEELEFTSIGGAPNAAGGSIEVGLVVADGDINVDGKVDVIDVLLATRFALVMDTPDAGQLAHGNVAPLVGGVPAPTDSKIGVDDVLLIQKKALSGSF